MIKERTVALICGGQERPDLDGIATKGSSVKFAKISSSKLQRTLSLRGGDRPSCPHRTLLGFELPVPPAKKQLF